MSLLCQMPPSCIHTCVTSPPYFGLRDYGVEGQIGLEETPDAYVNKLVGVFREVRRVLRDDGTLWLNLGDSYNNQPAGNKKPSGFSQTRPSRISGNGDQETVNTGRSLVRGMKPKDLIGIPWRVAFALQADGWYLRQDIIWHKPNPMPESVKDRCTKAHEYIFLLSKSAKYYFDSEAIQEPTVDGNTKPRSFRKSGADSTLRNDTANQYIPRDVRNKRDVWTITTKPFKGAHFATFPPDLIEPCVLAGCPVGGVVLDPFAGSGTTLQVAVKNGRYGLGLELNPDYIKLIHERMEKINGTV